MIRRRQLGTAILAFAGVAILPGAASAATFSNTSPITINDSSTNSCPSPNQVQAPPYPSQIVVSGQQGTVSDANVTVNGFSHTSPADVRVLVVGPGGQSTQLMSDSGGGNDASDVTITFDDAAATVLPNPIVSGTFKPSQEATGCNPPFRTLDFPSPAPPGPYGADLTGFNGTNANGTWSLYVVDAFIGDIGSISGGWTLDLAGVTPAPTGQPPAPTTPAKKKKCKKKKKKHSAESAKKKKCKKKKK